MNQGTFNYECAQKAATTTTKKQFVQECLAGFVLLHHNSIQVDYQ